MGKGPRNYLDNTLKRLYALSGNQCAFPGCKKKLVNQKNALDSNICHIEAASPDGERWNPDMTDEQRADYHNLVLLCVQHHAETNDVEKYTAPVLREMKRNHESQYLNERINRNRSMLKNTITALSNIDLTKYPEEPVANIIDPEEKIKFNNLQKNSHFIKEYRVYHTKLNVLYKELENQGSLVKEKLLRFIKLTYDKIKSSYVGNSPDTLRVVQENSDAIFDEVYNQLYAELADSQIWDEDIVLGLNIILVDAFIRCKILEEPVQ
jgi:hypothetical protein